MSAAAQEGAGGATSPVPDSGDDGPAQPIRPGHLSQNSDGPAGARTCLCLSPSRRTLPGSGPGASLRGPDQVSAASELGPPSPSCYRGSLGRLGPENSG